MIQTQANWPAEAPQRTTVAGKESGCSRLNATGPLPPASEVCSAAITQMAAPLSASPWSPQDSVVLWDLISSCRQEAGTLILTDSDTCPTKCTPGWSQEMGGDQWILLLCQGLYQICYNYFIRVYFFLISSSQKGIP